jgi:uncharacterized membrane protein YfcA
MTPLLVLVFGVNPAIAVGTDLLYAAITKCGGILVHHKQRTIDWRIVRLMAAGSLPGAGLTLLALRHFQQEGMDYMALITSTLGVALILTSLVLLFKRQLLEFSYRGPFPSLLLGSLPGIYLSSNLGVRLPDQVVRPVLASMLLFIGIRFAL